MTAIAFKPPGVDRLQARVDAAQSISSRGVHPDDVPGSTAPVVRGELVEINLAALAEAEPQPPRFIVPDWIPEGEVTLLAADGGTGKSLLALELAVCVALGLPWHGKPVERRDAVFVSFEDKAETLHWRLRRLCTSLGVRIEDLLGRLTLLDGTQAVDAWYGRGEHGALGETSAFAEAAERIGSDRLVVVDGVADVFAGSEIARAEVKSFVRMVRRLAGKRGAVLLITHVDKRAAQEPEDALGFSGSTAWSNSVRCRWYMYRERDGGAETGCIRVEVRKSNLGRTGDALVLAYDERRHVFVDSNAGAPSVDPRPLRRVVESDAVLAVIAEAWRIGNPIPVATGGPRTGYSVAKAFPDYPRSARGLLSKARFDTVVNELRNAGAIEVVGVPRANRKRSEVLRATGQAAPQSAECAPPSGESS